MVMKKGPFLFYILLFVFKSPKLKLSMASIDEQDSLCSLRVCFSGGMMHVVR